MKRRVLSVLLVIVMLLGMMPTAAMAAGTSLPVDNDATYTTVDINDQSLGSGKVTTLTLYLQTTYAKVNVDCATQDGNTIDIVLREDTDPAAAIQVAVSGSGLPYPQNHSGNQITLVNGTGTTTYTFTAGGSSVTHTINFTTATSAGGDEGGETVEPAGPIGIAMTFADGGEIVEVDGEKIYNIEVVVYDDNEDGKLTIGEAFAAFHDQWYDGENGYAETNTDFLTGWVTNFWGKGSSRFSYALNYGWAKSTQVEIEEGDQLTAYFGQAADYSDLLTWFGKDSYEAEAGTVKEFSVNGISIYKSGESANATAVPSGATVTVYDSNGSAVSDLATTTDENGKFSLNFSEAGDYSIVVDGTCSYTCNGVTTSSAPVVPAYCQVTVKAAEESEEEEIVLSGSCTGYDVSFAVSGATVKSAKTTPNGNNGTLDLVVTDVTGSTVDVTAAFSKYSVPMVRFSTGYTLKVDVSTGSGTKTDTVLACQYNGQPMGNLGAWTVKVTVDGYEAPATLTFTTDLSEEAVTYTAGDTAAALTVAATQSKGAAVTYQWYKNTTKSTIGATAIEGANAASYIPDVTAAGTTYYYAVATSGELTATSQIATITVEAETPATLTITTDLSEAEVKYTEGDKAAALTVAATQSKGEAVTYRWYKNTTKSTEGATAIATGSNYIPTTENPGTTYYYAVATSGELTATSKIAMITVVGNEESEEPAEPGVLDLDIATSNGSVNSVKFTDEAGSVIEGLTAVLEDTTIKVNVPRSVGPNGKVMATFDLTQNSDGLPFLTTKTGATGTSSGKAVNNKFTEKTTTLSGGMATFTFYLYNSVPKATSNNYTTYTIQYVMANNAPELTGDAAKSDTGVAGTAYELNVPALFKDADGDAMTYKVSVDGAAAVAAELNENGIYSYTTMDAGTHTLVFTAHDAYSGVSETYTLTLEIANSATTYDVTVEVPKDVTPTFYYTADAEEGTTLEATTENSIYTVKVPTNVSTIAWRYDGMGMSAAVSAEKNSLTLVQTKYIVMAGENVDKGAVVTVKYGELTALGKDNTFLLLSTGSYTVSVQAGPDYTTGWKNVTLTNQTTVAGEVYIDLESKEIPFTVPYFADLYVCKANERQGIPTTEIEPTKTGTTDFATGTRTDSYNLQNGTVYEYRVSVPGNDQYVTFVGMFKKTDSTTGITVTKAQIEDGSNGRTTVDHSLTPYTSAETLDMANVADLYMNVNAQGYLKLSLGQTKDLYTARSWWATNCGGWAMNTYRFLEPDYHYTVVGLDGKSGSDVVTIDEKGKITAVGDGTAIVLVTYDAMNVDIDDALYQEAGPESPWNDGFFSAIWPENTGVFVVSVGASASGITTGMTINEKKGTPSKTAGKNLDAEHDVIYFLGDKGEYTFTPGTEGVTVSVANPTISGNAMSFGGFQTVAANADGTVTVPLTHGRNIVKFAKGDAAEYQVITAKHVNVTVNGKSLDEAVVAPGDAVTIVFDTLYNPVNRLAIYNTGAAVVYSDISGCEGQTAGNYSGGMGFYFFASHAPHQTVANFNMIGNDGSSYGNYAVNLGDTLVVPEDFEEDYFTLSDGAFYVSGFSKFTFGQHREAMGQAPSSGGSSNIYSYFGSLPEIAIRTTNYVEPEEPVVLERIAVTTQPTKTQYTVGETFDPAGMVVTATYSDDSTKAVTGFTCAPETFAAAGTQTVTVSYTEGEATKTTTVTVTVQAAEVPVTLSGIAVTKQPTKTQYTVGETFDPAGMVVTATYNDGSTKAVTGYTYGTAPFTEAGNQIVTIRYTEGGETKTAAVTVAVQEAAVTLESIAVTTQPTKKLYNIGEKFDPAGMVVTATYSDGTTEVVSGYTYPTTALDKNTRTVTVSYGGKTTTVAITMNVVERIAVTTQPTKTAYTEGETFDPTGMIVTATYTDGTTKEITTYKYTPTTALTLEDTTVVITYTGDESTATKRTSLTITVAEKTQTEHASISVNMSFINAGKIVVYNVPVAVVDEDDDGKYTIGNAFTALHEAYYSGGASGYAEMSNASLTGWVTKFWGKGSSGFCYVLNNSWTSSTQVNIKSGDSISAFFSQDLITYSDLYTWFDADSYNAVTGTAMTMTVNGMNVMGSGASGDMKAVPKGATVTVYDKNGKAVSALGTTVDANGQFTITFTEAGTYTVEVSGTASYGSYSDAPVVPSRCTVKVTEGEATEEGTVDGAAGLVFSDVKQSDYYYDAVAWAVEQGITTGTTSTTFAPNANCTRAQMVTFLWRAAGQPAIGDVRITFKDVDRNAYYYKALLWAISEGITTGVTETSFAPNATCTRAQMVTFLYRMADEPAVTTSHAFEDVFAEDYYNTAVAWAVQEGITTGMTETTFAPAAFCTRGQTVTFLYRLLAEKE